MFSHNYYSNVGEEKEVLHQSVVYWSAHHLIIPIIPLPDMILRMRKGHIWGVPGGRFSGLTCILDILYSPLSVSPGFQSMSTVNYKGENAINSFKMKWHICCISLNPSLFLSHLITYMCHCNQGRCDLPTCLLMRDVFPEAVCLWRSYCWGSQTLPLADRRALLQMEG